MAFSSGSDAIQIVVEVDDTGAAAKLQGVEAAQKKVEVASETASQKLDKLEKAIHNTGAASDNLKGAFAQGAAGVFQFDAALSKLTKGFQTGLLSEQQYARGIEDISAKAQKSGLLLHDLEGVISKNNAAFQQANTGATTAASGFSKFQASVLTASTAFLAGEAALRALKGAVSEVFGAISRGSNANDLAEGFEFFAAKAGVLSDVLLNDLRNATAGTISDFELMQRANESMLAGLDPSKFSEVATQTRQLAEVTGVDLKSALDIVNDALVRGNDKGLKSRLGLNVDLVAGENALKAALGDSAGTLSESAKVEADRIAILAALSNATKDMGVVTDDAGDKIAQMSVEFHNSIDAALRNVAANQGVNKSLDELKVGLANIDWNTFITGATKAAIATGSFFLSLGNKAATGLADTAALLKNPLGGTSQVSDEIKKLDEGLRGVVETLGRNTPEATAKAKEQFNQLRAEAEGTANVVKNQVFPAFETVYKQLYPELQAGANKTGESQKKLGVTGVDLKKIYEDLAGTLGKDAFAKTGASAKKLHEEFKKGLPALDQFSSKVDQLIKSYQAGTYTGDQFSSALDDLRARAVAAGIPIEDLSRIIQKDLGQAIDATDKKLDGLAKKTEKATKVDFGKTLNSLLGGGTDAAGNETANITGISGDGLASITESIGNAVIDGIENGFTSEDVVAAAGQAGDALGAAFGVPFVGQFTSMFAESLVGIGKTTSGSIRGIVDATFGTFFPGAGAITEKLTDGMFGDSAATSAKKKADKFFADLFDANAIAVSIGGELSQVKDLVFSGNQDPLGGIFSTLPEQAKEEFNLVGDAIAESLGLGTEEGLNLGVVLANNNIALADLATIAEAAGLSFEDLADQMFEAFYLGNESVLELQQSLEELYNTMSGTSAFADLGAAFNGVAEAGFNGGRQLLNAMGAVGIMAQQLGAQTLPELANILVNHFGVSTVAVANFITAITAAGISSVAQLAAASNATLAAAGANLQEIEAGGTPTHTTVDVPTPRYNFGAPSVSAPKTGGGGGGGGSKGGGTKTDPNKEIARDVQQLILASSQYSDILDQLEAKTLNATQAQKKLSALYKEVWGLEKQLSTAEKQATTELEKKHQVTLKTATSISKLKEKLEEFKESRDNDKLLDDVEKTINSSDTYKDLLEGIGDGSITAAQGQAQLDSMYKSLIGTETELEATQKKANEELKKTGTVSITTAQKLAKLEDAVDNFGEGSKTAFEVNGPLHDFMAQFKGDTDKLNLGLQAAGVSFADIEKKATNAFLAGKQTFSEAKKALDELNGGTSAKVQFDAFADLGTNGGTLSVDLFQKIGKAILNAGGTSLDSLSEQLLGSGESADRVQKYFIALQNTGISSLDAIANATPEAVIKVGDQLQQLGFDFGKTTTQTQELLSDLDKIRNTKTTVTVEIKAVMQDGTFDLLDQFNFVPQSIKDAYQKSSPGTATTTTPAAGGNDGAAARARQHLENLKKRGKTKEAKAFKAASPYV